jgi:hypothetical protein
MDYASLSAATQAAAESRRLQLSEQFRRVREGGDPFMSSYGASPQPYVVAMPLSPSMQHNHHHHHHSMQQQALQQDYAMRSFASQMQRVPPYSPARASQGYGISPHGGRFSQPTSSFGPPPPGYAYVVPTPVVSPRLIAQQRREAAHSRQRSPVQSPVRTVVVSETSSAESSDAPPTYLIPTESSRLKNINSLDMSIKHPRSTSPSNTASYAPQSPTLAGSDSEIVSMPAGELRQLRRQVQELRAARLREHDIRETSVSDSRKAKTEAAAARIAVEAKEAELRVAKAKLLEISHLLRQVSARAVKNEPLTGREMHQISIAVQAVHPDMLFGQLNAAAQQAIASATRDAATAMMLAERANAPPKAPSPLPFSYASRVSPKAIAEAMTFSPSGDEIRSRSPNQNAIITSSQLSQSASLDRDRIKRALLSEVQVELQAASVAASQHFTSNGAADLVAALTNLDNTGNDMDVTSLADEILVNIDSAEARSRVAQNTIKATLYTVNDQTEKEGDEKEEGVYPEPVVVVVPSISPKKLAKPLPPVSNNVEPTSTDGLPVKRLAASRPTAEEVLPPSVNKVEASPSPPVPVAPVASVPPISVPSPVPTTRVVSISASPSSVSTKSISSPLPPPPPPQVSVSSPAPSTAPPASLAPTSAPIETIEASSKVSPPLPEKRRIGALSSFGPPSRPAPPLPEEKAPDVPLSGPPVTKASIVDISIEPKVEESTPIPSPPPPPPPAPPAPAAPATYITTTLESVAPTPPALEVPAPPAPSVEVIKTETKPASKWGPGAIKKTEEPKKEEAPAKVTPAWMQKKNAAASAASAVVAPSTLSATQQEVQSASPPVPAPPPAPSTTVDEDKASPKKPTTVAPVAPVRARPGPPPPSKTSVTKNAEEEKAKEEQTKAPIPPERKISNPPPPPPPAATASSIPAASGDAPRKPSGPPPPPARKSTPPPSRSGSDAAEPTSGSSSSAPPAPPAAPASRKAPPPPSKAAAAAAAALDAVEASEETSNARKAPPPPPPSSSSRSAPPPPVKKTASSTSEDDADANFSVKRSPIGAAAAGRSAPPPPPRRS